MRGLDMGFGIGYAEVSRILWSEALGTAGLEKLRGSDSKRDFKPRRGEIHRRGAHLAYGTTP
jgi:hypothetical protein